MGWSEEGRGKLESRKGKVGIGKWELESGKGKMGRGERESGKGKVGMEGERGKRRKGSAQTKKILLFHGLFSYGNAVYSICLL